MTLRATYLHPLPSDLGKDPFNGLPDVHIEYKPLSAATLGVIVADPTKITIKPQRDPNGGVCVTGSIAPMPAIPPTGGQGTQLQVDILGAKHDLMGTKPVFPDRFGQFKICWASTEIRDLALARYAATIYQGQADLAPRTGTLRAQNLGQTGGCRHFPAARLRGTADRQRVDLLADDPEVGLRPEGFPETLRVFLPPASCPAKPESARAPR